MTFCHMALKGVIAWLTIKLLRLPVPVVSRREFLLQACPIGAFTGLDIACSNFSFLYVTVTFATMVKPCGLLWTCALAICLGLEKATPTLIAVVLCIFLGVFLASFGETAFSLPGFVLVILSTLFSAVRWVLTQSMLNSALKSGESTALGQKDAGLFSSGPVVLLYLISPSAAISLIPLMVRPSAVL